MSDHDMAPEDWETEEREESLDEETLAVEVPVDDAADQHLEVEQDEDDYR